MSFGYQVLGFGSSASGGINPFTEATGGTVTTSGNYKIHTFTSSGTFEVTNVGDSASVDYLVVAGGGAGGGGYDGNGGSGAGGAGGYLTSSLDVSAQSYSITVGAGGSTNNGPTGS